MIDCQTTRVRIARVLIVSIFAAISVTADVLVGTGTSVAQASSLEAQAAAQKAVDWLKTQQQSDGGFEVAGFPGFETPDAVLAIAEQAQTTSTWNPSVGFSAVDAVRYGGSGPSPLDALDDLAEQAVTDGASGTAAKLIVLDAMPLGMDPSDFDPSGDSASPVDLSATLDPGGCSADTASFGFFSQTLYGILAKYLICSGNVPPSAISAVRNAQQANGGWNYLGDPNGTDIDIDTTGLAIQALVAGGADKSDPAVSKALGLLARAHNLDGSWNSPFASGDPNSTALGILGVTAAGFDVASSCWRDEFFPEGAGRPYVSPDSWLISRQDADGHIQSPNDSWGVNTFATSQSVEALLRGWLPVSRAGSAACTRRAYLAEGATAGGFETWVLLSNPNPAADASARLTFLTGEGPRPGPVVTVPPLARRSVRVDDYVTSFDVSTVVESLDPDFPVYSERAVYSTSPGKEGAHLGKEIRKPAGSWFLPEGATAGGFETWVLVANPDETQSADVTVTYLTGSGQVPGPSFTLAPGSRRSIRVNDTVPSDFDVATKVSSSGAGVVAERAMYMGAESRFRGATASPGIALAGDKWFLPEGATAGGFETWVLVANPDETQSADVTVTYLTGSGQVPGPSFTLAPGSRRSIRVNDTVPSDFDVATKVSSSGAGVVVERALYSNHPTLGITSSSGEGVGWTADKWFLPEGATAGGFETWVLVANPDETQSADVTVTYLTGSGQVPGPSFTLAPGSRRSIRVNDTVPSDFDVATKVSSSGAGVVVDHSIYSPASLSGDASGGPGLAAS